MALDPALQYKKIGLSDELDIPAAELFNVPCKIDTGAYNCSIDCSHWAVEEINGTPHLLFTLLGNDYKQYSGISLKTTDFIRKKVKSSTGHVEYRYQVSLTIVMFGESVEAAFNLSKRHNMRYPILLGRKFLSKKFLVDVSKKNISKKLKAKQNISN
jgi:hypothetical protein